MSLDGRHPVRRSATTATAATTNSSTIKKYHDATGKYGRTRKGKSETVLIVNPNSCSGLTGKNWDSLYSSIQKILGENLTVIKSRKPGDGTVLTREFLKKGYTTILAIGGDGTINEVANGFFENPTGTDRLKPINKNAIMGVVPCGTRNVLVKSLDLPGGVVECCRFFMGGKPKKIDVIAAIATNPKDGSRTTPRVFLNAAEVGFGAEIISRSKRIRKEINSRLLSTAASIIATLPSYQSNVCEIQIDGGKESITTKMTLAVVANGRFIGGDIIAAPDADVADGLLDLLVLKNSESLSIIDTLADVKRGNFADNGDIIYTQARKVTIDSKERDVTVAIDGEPIGKLPATFYLLKNSLTIRA